MLSVPAQKKTLRQAEARVLSVRTAQHPSAPVRVLWRQGHHQQQELQGDAAAAQKAEQAAHHGAAQDAFRVREEVPGSTPAPGHLHGGVRARGRRRLRPQGPVQVPAAQGLQRVLWDSQLGQPAQVT